MRPYLNRFHALADAAFALFFVGFLPIIFYLGTGGALPWHGYFFASYLSLSVYLLVVLTRRGFPGLTRSGENLLNAGLVIGLMLSMIFSGGVLVGSPVLGFQAKVMGVDALLLATIILFLTFTYSHKVPRAHIVVVDQYVYYPGETFVLNPLRLFSAPKVEVVGETMVFGPGEIDPVQVRVEDDSRIYVVEIHVVRAAVLLNHHLAKAKRVRTLDLDWFCQDIARWIHKLLETQIVPNMPLHELLRREPQEMQYTAIGDFPVSWHGEATLSFTPAVAYADIRR